MKVMTVRLPDSMAAEIEAESRVRNISKSDIVRERIDKNEKARTGGLLALVEDLIVADEELPRDLSARTKYYLRKTGFGKSKRADYGKTRR
jgi:Arc/MetJ-type ribon-helix-helix transcriptional regulator